ncbi:MAG: bifunctional diaminohydroxyphosphoribosylaminopyrimidine deaminase/5-amino-6-(5-phosphoribosylamino)uracil reductase RibD [Candidatus Micrarchaeota archaeon]|nr:bifunctional diaminohydroxyphosphoribosylaminopyrimidine deaminase/5-amino-6-(5-phosphoribosylamino)uracil reductase RibD [Candidatus Micrarchaeota archaeon]
MQKFMKLALRLAKKANPSPNPRVGAVLVKGNKIIGAGYHKKAGLPHAEIEAIENAKLESSDPEIVKGATLYVTLEPCSHTNKRTPPCTKAIIANKIKRVVFAMNDPNPFVDGARELQRAGIEVSGPTDEKTAAGINKAYLRNVYKKII